MGPLVSTAVKAPEVGLLVLPPLRDRLAFRAVGRDGVPIDPFWFWFWGLGIVRGPLEGRTQLYLNHNEARSAASLREQRLLC